MPIVPFDGPPHQLAPGVKPESSRAVQLAAPSGDYRTPAPRPHPGRGTAACDPPLGRGCRANRSANRCVNQPWDNTGLIGPNLPSVWDDVDRTGRNSPCASHHWSRKRISRIYATASMEGDSRAVTAALHGCRSEVGVAPAPPRARCPSSAIARTAPSALSLLHPRRSSDARWLSLGAVECRGPSSRSPRCRTFAGRLPLSRHTSSEREREP